MRMFVPVQIAEQDQENTLNQELHLLEVETFEIEDFADLEQNPAAALGCSSCSSCCSTSSPTSK